MTSRVLSMTMTRRLLRISRSDVVRLSQYSSAGRNRSSTTSGGRCTRRSTGTNPSSAPQASRSTRGATRKRRAATAHSSTARPKTTTSSSPSMARLPWTSGSCHHRGCRLSLGGPWAADRRAAWPGAGRATGAGRDRPGPPPGLDESDERSFNSSMGRIAGVTAAETRERLLLAAADVFAERGYDGTRVADIATAAGVSNGAMYAHFPSKAELLADALRTHGRRLLADVFAADPDRSITDLLLVIGRWLPRRRDRPRAVTAGARALLPAAGHGQRARHSGPARGRRRSLGRVADPHRDGSRTTGTTSTGTTSTVTTST